MEKLKLRKRICPAIGAGGRVITTVLSLVLTGLIAASGMCLADNSIPDWVPESRQPALAQHQERMCSGVESALEFFTGQAVIVNVTKERAVQIALNRARIKAIEFFCGISVTEHKLVKDAMFAGAYLASQSSGKVIEEEELKWDVIKGEADSDGSPSITLAVQLGSCVSCEKGERDPYFKIDARLNKNTFSAGEKVQITFKANQVCYLYIFNLMANDLVRCLLPCFEDNANPVSAGKTVTFPQAGGLELNPLEGHPVDHEAFMVVAVKKPFDFTLLFSNGVDVELPEFLRELITIPEKDRQEQILVYQVRKKP